MNIVNLCFYAYGNYSGASYEENIMITEDFYNKIKDKVKGLTLFVNELDGKYSETKLELSVSLFNEEIIQSCTYIDELRADGDIVSCAFNDLCFDNGLDLDENMSQAQEYLQSVDKNVSCTVTIKRSDIKKLNAFVKQLNQGDR